MRSGWERTLDTQLKRANVRYSYETLTLPFVMHHKYRPDFMLENGIVIEAKGVLNKHKKDEASKLIAVKQQHPASTFVSCSWMQTLKSPERSRLTDSGRHVTAFSGPVERYQMNG